MKKSFINDYYRLEAIVKRNEKVGPIIKMAYERHLSIFNKYFK